MIRLATVKDLPDLRLLFQALVVEEAAQGATYPRIDEAELDNFTLASVRILENPRVQIWVATVQPEDRPFGFLLAEVLDREIGTPHRYVFAHWIYMHPNARRVGLGKKLMAACAQWATQNGCREIECSAALGDRQWVRRGFTPVGMRHVISAQALWDYAHRPPTPPPADVPPPKKRRGRPPKHVNGEDYAR